MLRQLYLNNFVLVDACGLDFANGLTVMTGETGAGKSIILDAIEWVMGGRSEPQLIQTHKPRCEVSAVWDSPEAIAWLTAHELDEGDSCIVRRILNRDGRSSQSINGRPCTLRHIRELATIVLQMHSQNQQARLLKPDCQLELLDHYGQHTELSKTVRALYQEWHKTHQALNRHQREQQDHASKQELLAFQLQEFEQLAIQPDELAHLLEEQRRLSHTEQWLGLCHAILEQLTASDKAGVIGTLQRHQQQLAQLHPDLTNAQSLLEQAIIQSQEAAAEIQRYADHLEADPERLHQIEARLSQLYELARKHKILPEQLLEREQYLQAQWEKLSHQEHDAAQLAQTLKILEAEYQVAAQALTKKREAAAVSLSERVTQLLSPLGMPHAQWYVRLLPRPESHPTPEGLQTVCFEFNANPGQIPQPLTKVASGGELSRIALALQVCIAQTMSLPTLVFDEVDVGISGGVAEMVGQQLKQLAQQTQVICVTHLPQVAAQSDHHLQVRKIHTEDDTRVEIETLSHTAKVSEIARMLGGVQITDKTMAYAREMVR